jgi:hypothetical protein|tara:strand:+ start:10637 stop:10978 length:342 start_codon:yes stop_codon:yes gene_type:complete
MKCYDVKPEHVAAIYRIFEGICEPKNPVAEAHPINDIADRIVGGGAELRVTSKFGVHPKLLFRKGLEDTLEVSFIPNIDATSQFESGMVDKSEEISAQFDSAVKSYFRNVDKR